MPMDSDTLLRLATLSLAEDLVLRAPQPGRLIVQNRVTGRHLVLTPAQWTALQAFGAGRTVPAVLRHLIDDRSCIPLHDFYELVLKAHETGVLLPPRARLAPGPAGTRRQLRLPGPFARPLAGALFGAIAGLLILAPPTAPGHAGWWALGWLLTGVALSLGEMLAAGAIRAADIEVPGPRFRLRSLLPALRYDLRAAILDGPGLRVDCALWRLLPIGALLAAATVWAEQLILPLLGGLLLSCSPLWESAGTELLRALRQAPPLSSEHAFLFPPNRRWQRRLRFWLTPRTLRFALLRGALGAVWLAAAALLWAQIRPADLASLLGILRETPALRGTPRFWLGLALAPLALLTATLILALLARLFARLSAWRRRSTLERARARPPAPGAADLAAFLGETYPFTLLPVEERRAVAEAFEVEMHPAGGVLLRPEDTRPLLRVLYAGRLSACRGTEPRPVTLHPGSIFGEQNLLQDGEPTGEIRAQTACVVLTLSSAAYERHVSTHLPPRRLEEAARKMAFLRDVPLCRRWPGPVLAALARRAQVQSFPAGATLFGGGRETASFHLLEAGELSVTGEGRRMARLLRGDFFGELGLLGQPVTDAEIVAQRPGRCLAVPRQDFLVFLAHDTEVALQFERIASRRLGRPVFGA